MITLAWMIQQLSPHLSFEPRFDCLALEDRFQFIRPVVDRLIKEKNTKHWLMEKVLKARAKGEKAENYQDNDEIQTKVLAAEALRGWATGPIIDSFTGEMKVAGPKDRTPGEYKTVDLPNGRTEKLGRTNEYIHPVVQYRKEMVADYDPVPLRKFQRKASKDSSGRRIYEWVKGDVKIPEYTIPWYPMEEIERRFVYEKSARLWLGKLDKEYGLNTLLAQEMDRPPPKVKPQQTGFQPVNYLEEPHWRDPNVMTVNISSHTGSKNRPKAA